MKEQKKILVITPIAFHDNVGNAGAKTVNFYVGKFLQDINFNIAIAYLGDEDKDYLKLKEKVDDDNLFVAFKKKNLFKKAYDFFRFKYLYPLLKIFIPKYYITDDFAYERLKSCLDKVKQSTFYPDIIIVEFPRVIYWIAEIKAAFPKAQTVASCHDVTFQSVERFLTQKKRNRIFTDYYYNVYKKIEIRNLNQFDRVVVLNEKDQQLLINEPSFDANKVYTITPYYDCYKLNSNIQKQHVVYFASMSRMENVDAAEWFLQNVWIKINQYFGGTVKFIIVGGGLNENEEAKIKEYDNVILKGFVKDPTDIFNECFCFIVPLQLGAGIKIKVLDAMNSGIPVITNQIGIEGIPATRDVDYLHAETKDEFYQQLIRLKEDDQLQKSLAYNAKQVISRNFDYNTSYYNYKKLLLDLGQSNC